MTEFSSDSISSAYETLSREEMSERFPGLGLGQILVSSKYIGLKFTDEELNRIDEIEQQPPVDISSPVK